MRPASPTILEEFTDDERAVEVLLADVATKEAEAESARAGAKAAEKRQEANQSANKEEPAGRTLRLGLSFIVGPATWVLALHVGRLRVATLFDAADPYVLEGQPGTNPAAGSAVNVRPMSECLVAKAAWHATNSTSATPITMSAGIRVLSLD